MPTATNIATSACDGTYLGEREGREGREGKEEREGRERREETGGRRERREEREECAEHLKTSNTILRTFGLPLNVAPFCEVIIQGLEASV